MRSPLEQFDIINVKTSFLETFFNIDISLNNILIPFIFIILMVSIFIYLIKKQVIVISSYYQNVIETMYIFLVSLVKQQAHAYGLFWLPLIFTLFNLVLLCNLLSLIPFGIALTSHLILIFWLTSTICVSIFTIGILRFNLKFLHIFIPQCPFVLLPILIPIEIFSYFIRLFSLSIRLAANILAGHTLVHIIVTFILNVSKTDAALAIICVVPLFLILILEFGVAFLQAYVFSVLVCIYLSDTEKLGSH